MSDLGIQAAKKILSSSNPIQMLQDIAQNFPVLASALSNMKITNSSLKDEIAFNQQIISAAQTSIFLNGRALDLEKINIFK